MLRASNFFAINAMLTSNILDDNYQSYSNFLTNVELLRQSWIVSKVPTSGNDPQFLEIHSTTLPLRHTLIVNYVYTESNLRHLFSLSNFFDSENIGLKHSFSLASSLRTCFCSCVHYTHRYICIHFWVTDMCTVTVLSGKSDVDRPSAYSLDLLAFFLAFLAILAGISVDV